ncbi:MAG: T9SS type A sorting domain-containing protein, partial [Planctomycetota bacterium]
TDVLEPTAFVLTQKYPNPFNPSTLIEDRLARGQHARIGVYNAAGQQVDVLVDAWRCAGAHLVQWNGRGRGSGTYFLRLRAADDFQITRKMVLIR